MNILELLPANDRALAGRLVCHDAWKALSGRNHCTAFLTQPLQPHAAPWAQEAVQQHLQRLPREHKWLLLYAAAASGCVVNMEAVLEPLEPYVIPELLVQRKVTCLGSQVEPAFVAVRGGHLQLLRWMLGRCPQLVGMGWNGLRGILEGAARYCDLAGLQEAWEVLSAERDRHSDGWMPAVQGLLDAAAQSTTPDAVAKMQWVLQKTRGFCVLQDSTAMAAIRTGDLARLEWLLLTSDSPARVRFEPLLSEALQHADLAVAKWLVEVGCELTLTDYECIVPDEEPVAFRPLCKLSRGSWLRFYEAAAGSSDWLAKLSWLREQGGPPLKDCVDRLLAGGRHTTKAKYARASMPARVETALMILATWPSRSDEKLLSDVALAAVDSGSVPTAERARSAGAEFPPRAYVLAATQGDVAMVKWLALEARVPLAKVYLEDLLTMWPDSTPADSRSLLEAVQLLTEAGSYVPPSWAPYSAAQGGHLALLQYLRGLHLEADWPVGRLFQEAVGGGCEALLLWLWDGCRESPMDHAALYLAAAKVFDGSTLDTLVRLGVPWGAPNLLLRMATAGCKLPVLRWLAKKGAPLGSGSEVEAALEGPGSRKLMARGVEAWLRGKLTAGAGEGSHGLEDGGQEGASEVLWRYEDVKRERGRG